jgi:tellurite methyltransferase
VKRCVADWLATDPRCACLDLRPEAEFAAGHLPGAGNLPFDELEVRIHELPRPGEALFLVGGAVVSQAAELLGLRDRWPLSWSEEPAADWPADILTQGAAATLWSPHPWLREHHTCISTGGRVMDLAMGKGRDAVFLAMQGHQVEGEDILPETVAAARQLAARHGVTIDARVGDVTRPGLLETKAFDGIVVFNFLERALMPVMAAALRPGGVLIYETYTTEQGRRVKRPRNPNWLLEPGELRDALAQELDILAYREGQVEEKRWVASLVGRRAVFA